MPEVHPPCTHSARSVHAPYTLPALSPHFSLRHPNTNPNSTPSPSLTLALTLALALALALPLPCRCGFFAPDISQWPMWDPTATAMGEDDPHQVDQVDCVHQVERHEQAPSP